jgi:para-nitrobenzyl esterase
VLHRQIEVTQLRKYVASLSLLFLVGCISVVVPARLCSQSTASSKAGPIATTEGGQLIGAILSDDSALFQDIPYAEPPVGNLRWRDPQPPAHWAGVRDATKAPPACMQGDWKWNHQAAKDGNEDCLYLNIATPSWPVAKKLPVMFWIHGGANYNGSGRLNGMQTLTRHGVILVSINYRLGVFGFLSHPELRSESSHHSSGNYALLDQIAALRWVHENIAAFGGDPSNVTIFGQSAGAIDVGMLLVSPLSKGLFARAIDESGGPISPQPLALTPVKAEDIGSAFAEFVSEGKTGDAVARLRSMSAEEILDAANRFTAPDAEGVPTRPFPSLSVDGWVLPAQPAALLLHGESHRVPLLIGSNVQEFSFAHTSVISNSVVEPADQVRDRIRQDFGQEASQAIALYGLAHSDTPAADPLLGTAGTQLMTDTYFRCPATITSEWLSAQGGSVWQYQFERPLPGTGATSTRHSGELPYVFGEAQLPGSRRMGAIFGPTDASISELMQTYWTNFAKTGDPNGQGVPAWPQVEPNSPELVRFTSDGPVLAKNQRLPLSRLYEENLKAQLEKTAVR